MDIVKNKSKVNFKRIGLIIALAITCVFISAKLWSSAQNISLNVDALKVQTAKVMLGSLQVKVSVFGKISSNNINVISSEVSGVVSKIHIKSGDKIAAGQILAELINPELNQTFEETIWTIEELESRHRELLLNNKTLIIDAELALFETEKKLSINVLKLKAQTKLIELHNVVSKISYEETKLNNAMLQRQFMMKKEKLSHVKKQMAAKAEASVAKINKNKKILARAQSQVDALTIRSSFSGYIDESNIELGQNLIKGQKIAKIIGEDGFYAELKVPEYNASQVQINQTVLIETRNQIIEGKVTRISPSVEEGNVKVDVGFTSEASAKPRLEQAISGSIIVKNITDALYVKRPIYANNNLTTTSYINNDSNNQFFRQTISFGALSDDLIEIKEGANVGDTIITSDISAYVSHRTVTIK